MTTVVLVRHGRTSANASGVLAGRSPGVALDETGREQAAALAQRLTGAPLAAIVTSPMQRCRQTAAAVAEHHGAVPVTVEQGLTECGYGDWTGRPLKELAKDPLWRVVQTQPSAVRFPGGESLIEMASRAQQSIRDLDAAIAAEHGPDAVWVAVSHGDVIKAIVAEALGSHLDSFQRVLIDPASASVVRLTADRPYVACVNTTAGDLAAMLTPPKKPRRGKGRGRGRATGSGTDAPVGGGLGTQAR
ncbi:histidine phosphatase family protein [Microlunatus sp. Y2014]|uniref:histidine phosphatase family protein n=1 Tax=Microlunatus sp. Y2014 TaxID=3418488 RepID=UPI003DA6F538